MGFTNSPLVAFTLLSPNHSGQRTKRIDRISPHCVVGQCSAEGLGDWFQRPSTQASSNYGIDKDGRVGMYVEEKNRSWCTSSNENDQRAVTIECASGKAEPYAMNEVVYDRLIDLCVDICQRNGKKKLLWFGDKDKSLSYQPKEDEMLITVHRWFSNKSCPGNWLYARLGDLATKVTARLSGEEAEAIPSGMQAREFVSLSEEQVIAKVGALFTADQKESGILASVSMAQFILESGYGKSELAQGANNCFGMKKSLSGNTWGGSTWDGSSVYTKKTQEQNVDGSYVTITADFRRYGCVEDSIADHSAYLLGAKNGSKLRYDGLKGCTDYKKAVQIIKDGGYATSLTYVDKLCSIIKRWKLTQYDMAGEASDVVKYYRVRKSWEDAKSQLGAYTVLANAKAMADKHPGYEVYDWNGRQVYPEVAEGATSGMSNADCPFLVKVSISDLNIRKGAGTNTAKTGQYTGIGVFTIVEVREGKGSDAGWGRLKSGAGWIALSYCERV
ncbi:glucosaminidase domain-containing protein [Mogibacterium kristiansenii]|uniref:Mannosyl-glycoprotein endo-beta-N-acetylglucosamidase n=1 Tax=Mogibacterium kristiansenii TaxID=2606708 RepID=A0A6N7XI89_9FIRM|nr:glucosaminidase domain-containing protein [Mogibacterium kristiansenii]MST69785.1 mannosyl-glycoprotein endo-beta-N-acetylglucosamidase [Mogibacterium kristiansenii]